MKILNTLLTCVLFFMPAIVMAQPGDPCNGCNPDVPITGIEYLLGGGALLGVRHLIGRFKSSRKE